MKILNLFVVTLCGTLGVGNVFSQNTDHFYGGIGVGQGRAKVDDARINAELTNAGATSTTLTHDQNDTAYKVFGGYQFSPYFGLEGGYFKLGKFSFKSNSFPTSTLDGQINLEGINLDLIGYVPLNDHLSLLARFGIDNTRARDRFSSTGSILVNNSHPEYTDRNFNAGLGFSYKFNPNISLRGEFERYKINDAIGNLGDINVATLSLIFPFGNTSPAVPTVVEKTVYEVAPVVVIVKTETPPEVIVYKEVVAPVMPEHLHVSFNSDVLFGFDRSNVAPLGKIELDKFTDQLNGVTYDTVSIVGHTDRIGPKSYNDKLSLERADSVKAYLISRGIISEEKITTEGRGSSEPVTDVGACKGLHSSVDAIACLSSDRRVEVDVIGIKSQLP